MKLNADDALFPARLAVSDRMRQLVEKYPELRDGISREAQRYAEDVRGAKRANLLGDLGPEREEWLNDQRDIAFIAAFRGLTDNLVGAAGKVHGDLAQAVMAGDLTPTMRTVLATMHRAIEFGVEADEAMLVRQQSGGGRPSMSQRDDDIRRFVMSRLNMPGEPLKAADVHAHAAAVFSVSVKTIRNICASG